jgi:hypothetical protein
MSGDNEREVRQNKAIREGARINREQGEELRDQDLVDAAQNRELARGARKDAAQDREDAAQDRAIAELRDAVGHDGGFVFKLLDVVLNPGPVPASSTDEQFFAVRGLKAASDFLVGGDKPTPQAGLAVGNVRVVSDNVLGVTFINVTGIVISPTAPQRYKFLVARLATSEQVNPL